MSVCEGMNLNGEPCRAIPIAGEKFCSAHNPETAAKHAEASAKGGRGYGAEKKIEELEQVKKMIKKERTKEERKTEELEQCVRFMKQKWHLINKQIQTMKEREKEWELINKRLMLDNKALELNNQKTLKEKGRIELDCKQLLKEKEKIELNNEELKENVCREIKDKTRKSFFLVSNLIKYLSGQVK